MPRGATSSTVSTIFRLLINRSRLESDRPRIVRQSNLLTNPVKSPPVQSRAYPVATPPAPALNWESRAATSRPVSRISRASAPLRAHPVQRARHESHHHPTGCATARPRVGAVAREDQRRCSASGSQRLGRQRPVVDDVLGDDRPTVRQRLGEDHIVRRTPEIGPLRHRHDVVAAFPQRRRYGGRPHLVEQQLHLPRSSRPRRQSASARSASSSTLRIHAPISSLYSA